MEPFTCFCLLTIIILGYVFITRSIYTSGATNVPGPKGWPLLGNAHIFYGVDNGEKAFIAFKSMAGAHDSPMSSVWLGPKLCILVKDPKFIETLFNHRALIEKDSDDFYKPLKETSGNGVFTRTTAEGWGKLRKPLANFLLPKNISNFLYTISLKTDEVLIKQLDKHLDGKAFNLTSYIKACSFEILIMSTLGLDSLDDIVDDKYELMEEIDQEVEKIMSNLWNWAYLLRLKKHPIDGAQKLHRVPNFIMKELKARIKQQGRNIMTGQLESYAEVIFRACEEENLTHDDGQLLSDYLIAGSDTQSVASLATLLFLAINQEYQAKVVEELEGIFGDSTRDANEGDLKRMVYLEMCLKESLRFTCPPTVIRLAGEDFEFGGYKIPQGAKVLFMNFLVMRDPRYWERPEEFYPDHFLPEAVAKRPKGAFLPFAAGPRNCPGQAYSFKAMKGMVSTLIRRYHWTSDMKFSEIQFKYLLMREPLDPRVKLTRRVWRY